MSSTVITEQLIEALREKVKPYLSANRYKHVLGVEREAETLGRIFLPDSVNLLRTAALLHDITKKLTPEEHIALASELGVAFSEEELLSPKLFHANTGAELAKRDFPEYAEPSVISAIRLHTTGHPDMNMFESIIYLADYIEDTRTFDDCIELRKFFYDNIEKASGNDEKYRVFVMTMIKSFDMTIRCLVEENGLIDRNTVEARNRFLTELKNGGINERIG